MGPDLCLRMNDLSDSRSLFFSMDSFSFQPPLRLMRFSSLAIPITSPSMVIDTANAAVFKSFSYTGGRQR